MSEQVLNNLTSDELKAQFADDELYGPIFAMDGLNDEVEMVGDTLRWKQDPLIRWMVDQMDLNDFWHPSMRGDRNPTDTRESVSKNDPRIRAMYRKMGYSVFGYWEIFWWEVNNPIADEWKGDAVGE